MGVLEPDMTHTAAVAHLRGEVAEVAKSETGRLVVAEEPAFFGAVRGVMCDLDYVGALYAGWNGHRRDRIATKDKTVRFIRDVMSTATGEDGYRRWSKHLYELYRTGVVHLRAPKVLHNSACDPPRLAWLLMFDRRTDIPEVASGSAEHLRVVRASAKQATAFLPVSIRALFEDHLAAVEYFAQSLETEADEGGHALLHRWRETANALCEPDPTSLDW